MSSTVDWLPLNHEALYQKANQTNDYLKDATVSARMGFVSGSPQSTWKSDVFNPLLAAFKAAYEAWQNTATRSPDKAVALADAEAAFKPVYREFYTGFFKSSPLVTDVDLLEMGFPIRHTGGNKPAPTPLSLPEVFISLPAPAVIELAFRDSDSNRRAKPPGVHGLEIAYALLPQPPADWSALTHSDFDTQTPFRITFTGDDRGKTVYFATRWENTRGEKGPWTDIQSAIVP
jgi:hypothetical protein